MRVFIFNGIEILFVIFCYNMYFRILWFFIKRYKLYLVYKKKKWVCFCFIVLGLDEVYIV